MLSIKLNGEAHSFEEKTTVLGALLHLDIKQNGIAVAVNENIVSKAKWNETSLENNDEILIIKATQGG